MKLYLCFCIALSLVGAALCSPLDDYIRGIYERKHDDYVQTQHFQPYRTNDNMQGYTAEDINQPHLQYYSTEREGEKIQEINSNDVKTYEGYINAENTKEAENQMQNSQKNEKLEIQSVPSCSVASTNPAVVTHGAKVALQPLYQKLVWIGCAGKPCVKASCPRLYMEGSDWDKCWGEVFQIYRKAGPGSVKVGDVVGFYFKNNEWFQWGHSKINCPGAPTEKYGFASAVKWSQCGGEVYLIYAKGKSIGDTINDHDDVTIYNIAAKKWVALVGNHPDLRTCPGQNRPPPSEKYDECWGEIFELWLRKN